MNRSPMMAMALIVAIIAGILGVLFGVRNRLRQQKSTKDNLFQQAIRKSFPIPAGRVVWKLDEPDNNYCELTLRTVRVWEPSISNANLSPFRLGVALLHSGDTEKFDRYQEYPLDAPLQVLGQGVLKYPPIDLDPLVVQLSDGKIAPVELQLPKIIVWRGQGKYADIEFNVPIEVVFSWSAPKR